MTHGSAPCTGMVDEALKRPPAKLARTCRPGRRPPSRLLLEVDAGERLPVVIADDEAPPIQLWVGLFDGLSKVLTGCGVRRRFTQSAEG